MLRVISLILLFLLLSCLPVLAGRLDSALVNPQQAVQSKVKAFEKSSKQKQVDFNNDLISWQGSVVNTAEEAGTTGSDDEIWSSQAK